MKTLSHKIVLHAMLVTHLLSGCGISIGASDGNNKAKVGVGTGGVDVETKTGDESETETTIKTSTENLGGATAFETLCTDALGYTVEPGTITQDTYIVSNRIGESEAHTYTVANDLGLLCMVFNGVENVVNLNLDASVSKLALVANGTKNTLTINVAANKSLIIETVIHNGVETNVTVTKAEGASVTCPTDKIISVIDGQFICP